MQCLIAVQGLIRNVTLFTLAYYNATRRPKPDLYIMPKRFVKHHTPILLVETCAQKGTFSSLHSVRPSVRVSFRLLPANLRNR